MAAILPALLSLGCGGETSSSQPTPAVQSPEGRYLAVVRESAQLRRATAAGAEVQQRIGPNTYLLSIAKADLEQVHAVVGLLEPDYRRYPLGQTTPYGVTQTTSLQLPPLPSPIAKTTVCIVDSGYAPHPDLPSNVTGAPEGGAGPFNADGCGHGTHVAGTIAAVDNDIGVLGVAHDSAQLHIVRVFRDDCEWAYVSGLILAVQECASIGAQIVNLSLGGPEKSTLERLAFEQAEAQGLLIVAAAGNDGTTQPHYPASYVSVVSVGAVDSQKHIADFSQQNEDVELVAAGVGVLSTTHGTYQAWGGTSMATPHVSGAAAALMSRGPTWSAAQIRIALSETALDLGPSGRDDAYGFGLVQAEAAFTQLSEPAGCEPTSTSETECENDVDDDCDGLVDSADPDCTPAACQKRATPCSLDTQCCTKRCIEDPVYDYCL